MEKESSGKLLVLAANLLMHIKKKNRFMNEVRIASTVIALSSSSKFYVKTLRCDHMNIEYDGK